MQVELIVMTGPLRGTVAPIQVGHYLIGRHPECQIRPESRRVSRRHCLLWNDGKQFGASDLESNWGTFVNDQPLQPHVWKILQNGDVLRVGDFSFEARIRLTSNPARSAASATETRSPSSAPVVRPSPADPPAVTPPPIVAHAQATRLPADDASSSSGAQRTTNDATAEDAKQKAKKRARDAANELKRQRREQQKQRRTSKPFSSLVSIDLGNAPLKLLAASLIAVLVLGWFGYQIYRFRSGDRPVIRQGLD